MAKRLFSTALHHDTVQQVFEKLGSKMDFTAGVSVAALTFVRERDYNAFASQHSFSTAAFVKYESSNMRDDGKKLDSNLRQDIRKLDMDIRKDIRKLDSKMDQVLSSLSNNSWSILLSSFLMSFLISMSSFLISCLKLLSTWLAFHREETRRYVIGASTWLSAST